MLHASVKDLTDKNNGLGPTTSEINEDVSRRSSRPPKKELLPGMLRAIGCVEKEGRWVLSPTGNKSQQHSNESDEETLLLETVERFESDGGNIVPQVIAKELGCEEKYTWVVARLREMGFEQTNDIDPTSHLPIVRRRTSPPEMDRIAGLDDIEIEKTFDSGFAAGKKNPRSILERVTKELKLSNSDPCEQEGYFISSGEYVEADFAVLTYQASASVPGQYDLVLTE